MLADTICAIATPSGTGGVGIVRVSGPRAIELAARLLALDELEDRRVVHGWVRDVTTGERIDEVLAFVMRGPRSFTGEDVAELHGHGGAVNMARLLRAVRDSGARLAEPGEFTRRAFMNGRMDLTRAEAVAGIVAAASERALRIAGGQLAGSLGRRVSAFRETAIELRAEIEAAIDFPEEGLEPVESGRLAAGIAALGQAVGALAGTFQVGRALAEGVTVAFMGAPNVGKSSIFNALLGEERAVVTAEPGTTRDYLEARVVWHGVPVTLVDTAGEREATTEAERRGLELGRVRADRADVVIAVRECGVDAAVAGTVEIWNKADLVAAPEGARAVSARTGAGIEELRAWIVALATGGLSEGSDGEVVTSERQAERLATAASALRRAAGSVAEGRPLELVAEDLREAAAALGQVTGEEIDEAVLDALFARFCIGK